MGDATDDTLMTAYPQLEGPDNGEVYSVQSAPSSPFLVSNPQPAGQQGRRTR